MRALVRTGAVAAAVTVSTLSATTARADDDCVVEVDNIGFGFVLPDSGCHSSIHSDVTMSGVTEDWSTFGLRGSVEIGWLGQPPGFDRFQLGPVISLGGSQLAKQDDENVSSEFEALALVKTRYWLPGADETFYVEASVGPAMVLPPDGPARFGGYGELAVSAHGVLGVFFSVEPTLTVDGPITVRYALGGKTTAVGFAIVVAIYACAEVGCS
ncbi:MAG: hypothetical protein HOW73_03360 [Polyangiaceae bacterium]|nr:hypothetical protein [Polyangiaceae bacterium]